MRLRGCVIGLVCLLASLAGVACDAAPAALAPPASADAPAERPPETDPLRQQWWFYRQSVDLLTEWSREDTAVAGLMAKYPPAAEAEVTQIRRELRRLEQIAPRLRALQTPPGDVPVALWYKLLDARERELSLFRQFYRDDWRQNAARPREESVWAQAVRAGDEADELNREWLTIARKFIADNPSLAPQIAVPAQ